jgi:hypothetical protein
MMRILKKIADAFRSGREQTAEARHSWRPGAPAAEPAAEQPKRFSTLLPGAARESDVLEGAEEKPADRGSSS